MRMRGMSRSQRGTKAARKRNSRLKNEERSEKNAVQASVSHLKCPHHTITFGDGLTSSATTVLAKTLAGVLFARCEDEARALMDAENCRQCVSSTQEIERLLRKSTPACRAFVS